MPFLPRSSAGATCWRTTSPYATPLSASVTELRRPNDHRPPDLPAHLRRDRGIEFYGQLQSLLNGGDTYARFCQLFRKADERYNSGLFHFLPERDQADSPDMLTPGLLLDDKPAQGYPQQSLLSRLPLRVFRPAGRYPGSGLRAFSRQGHPPHQRLTMPWWKTSPK